MSNLIRIRTDDVLVHSGSMAGAEFDKWRKHHQWVLNGPNYFFHTAAILCSEIQDFPVATEYIRNEVAEKRLIVDLHGWEHIDYGKISQETIEEHLEKSFEFFMRTFGCLPYRWCTPWGAMSDGINRAARKFSLVVEGTDDPVIDQSVAHNIVRQYDSIEPMRGKTIMVHWFERGLKLFRIIQIAKHGSWEEAAKHHPVEFGVENTI